MDKLLDKISNIKLRDIMNQTLITIPADSPSGDAAKLMLKNKIHTLPVINPENKDEIINIITSYDLLGLTYYGRFSEDTEYISTKVTELIKEQNLVTLPPGASIKEAMEIIADKSIRTIPIVEKNKLVGIVSVIDIIRTIISI